MTNKKWNKIRVVFLMLSANQRSLSAFKNGKPIHEVLFILNCVDPLFVSVFIFDVYCISTPYQKSKFSLVVTPLLLQSISTCNVAEQLCWSTYRILPLLVCTTICNWTSHCICSTSGVFMVTVIIFNYMFKTGIH